MTDNETRMAIVLATMLVIAVVVAFFPHDALGRFLRRLAVRREVARFAAGIPDTVPDEEPDASRAVRP